MKQFFRRPWLRLSLVAVAVCCVVVTLPLFFVYKKLPAYTIPMVADTLQTVHGEMPDKQKIQTAHDVPLYIAPWKDTVSVSHDFNLWKYNLEERIYSPADSADVIR